MMSRNDALFLVADGLVLTIIGGAYNYMHDSLVMMPFCLVGGLFMGCGLARWILTGIEESS